MPVFITKLYTNTYRCDGINFQVAGMRTVHYGSRKRKETFLFANYFYYFDCRAALNHRIHYPSFWVARVCVHLHFASLCVIKYLSLKKNTIHAYILLWSQHIFVARKKGREIEHQSTKHEKRFPFRLYCVLFAFCILEKKRIKKFFPVAFIVCVCWCFLHLFLTIFQYHWTINFWPMNFQSKSSTAQHTTETKNNLISKRTQKNNKNKMIEPFFYLIGWLIPSSRFFFLHLNVYSNFLRNANDGKNVSENRSSKSKGQRVDQLQFIYLQLRQLYRISNEMSFTFLFFIPKYDCCLEYMLSRFAAGFVSVFHIWGLCAYMRNFWLLLGAFDWEWSALWWLRASSGDLFSSWDDANNIFHDCGKTKQSNLAHDVNKNFGPTNGFFVVLRLSYIFLFPAGAEKILFKEKMHNCCLSMSLLISPLPLWQRERFEDITCNHLCFVLCDSPSDWTTGDVFDLYIHFN